jgi:MFS family permease
MKNHNSSEKIRFLTKLILLMGANVALMAGSSLSPGVPAMLAEFKSIPGADFWVSMILTLPALFIVLSGPLVGWLVDRFGRKPVLVASLLLSGVAGSAAYFLTEIWAILITRALVGMSVAGATTATNALIADYFEGQTRARFMGAQSAFTGLAGVVFLSLGGFLADINWHLSFLAHAPLVILFPLAWIFISEPAVAKSNHTQAEDGRLKLTPPLMYIFSATFMNQFTFVTVPIYVAYFLADIVGATGTQIGLIGAASGLFSFFAGMLYERLGRRVPFREMTIVTFLLFGAGFLILGLSGAWTGAIIGQLLIGFCMGLMASNLTTWLASLVPAQVRGRANGTYVTLMFLGNFATSLVYTPIVNATSLSFAYILSAILVVVMAGAGILVKGLGRQS